MSEQQWNPQQLQAITARGSDLLVAAAAGSGKTAVLVERLLRRVTEEGCDVDSFLVVTFTRAAAAEMLEKFSRRLTALAAERPKDRRLRRQLRLLPRAHINTVHGFCSAFLREHFQMAGLSPDFRVLDSDEGDTLRRSVLSDLLEERYGSGSDIFNALSDALSNVRDDSRLEETILSLHDRMSAHPHPENWAESMMELAASAAEKEPCDQPYGQALLEDARHIVRYHLKRYRKAIACIEDNPALSRYRELIQAEADELTAFNDALERCGWDEIRGKLFHIPFARLPVVRSSPETEEGKQLIKNIRDAWKTAVQTLQTRTFSQTADEIRQDAEAVRNSVGELAQCAVELDAAYTEAKRHRNCVDFSDLEHLTLKLLSNPDGSPSKLARELSEEYAEIMVDEYQDTNAVQDTIFRILSRDNLFTVGDMKQSIYRFRLADPSIFLKRYASYADAEAAVGNEPRRVILSRNYRSRPEVLSASNRLFSAIFSPAAGELSYTRQEYLYPGREFPSADGDHRTELVLIETDSADEEETDEGASGTLQEARWVASRIRQMVEQGYPVTEGNSTRPASWGDFAILLRSFSGLSKAFTQALEEYGIPEISEHSADLFHTPEVSLVLAALDCVDNPRQDIPLTALMRAPMFAFTADELSALRLTCDGPYWQAVFAAAGRIPVTDSVQREASPDPAVFDCAAEKAGRMLSCLEELRRDVETLPLGRALWHICDKMGIFNSVAAMKFPEARRANLYTLFEYAYRFERFGYRGLYRFLEQLRRLRQSGKAPAGENVGSNADCVHLMTIHRSKGLQFPIVFVSGCGSRFNDRSLSEPVLVHPSLGLGVRRRLENLRVEYPTAAYHAIRTVIHREQRSEEMRILYVAMTRAEEKLILTAAVRHPEVLLEKYRLEALELPCPARAILDSHTMLEWMLRALLPEDEHFSTALAADWNIFIASPPTVPDTLPKESENPAFFTEDAFDTSDLTERLTDTVPAVYPYVAATAFPSKLTATQLRGIPSDALLDADAESLPGLPEPIRESLSDTEAETRKSFWNRPRFLMERGLTSTERGIALHMAMQFADYARCQTVFDCRLELERLEQMAFLTREQTAAVNPSRIVRFFHSALGQRLLAAKELHREFRFSLSVDPAIYTDGVSRLAPPGDKDSILLQGVIDAWFAEEDGLVIIDFKTDYVPPTGSSFLLERYRPQVTAYAHALRRITGRFVKECALYLFYTDETLYFDL